MPRKADTKDVRRKKSQKRIIYPPGIRRLHSGRFQVRVQVKIRGKVVNFCDSVDTLDEAVQLRLERQFQQRKGTLTAPCKKTVSEFALEWHENRKHLAASTMDGERRLLDLHIIPVIGNYLITEVEATDIEKLMAELKQVDDRNPRRKGHLLSTSMQKKVIGVLRQVFKKAYRQRLIPFDPAAAAEIRFIRPDREKTKRSKAWTLEEASRFYPVARTHFIGVAFCFALATGLRIGEVLGIRLNHVDLKTGDVSINDTLLSLRGKRHTSKGGKNENAMRLIHVAGDALEILREHSLRKSLSRDAYPEKFVETDYVFTNIYGNSILPDTIYRVMADMCREARVPYRATHVLRHTYTSVLAEAGVPVEVLSKQLGHADPAFTARVYRTVFDQERRGLTLDFTALKKKKRKPGR